MKSLLVLSALIGTVLCFKDSEEFKKAREECAAEFKIDLSQFKPGEKPDASLFENHDYQCFSKCLSTKSGMMDDSGEIDMDQIKEKLSLSDEVMEEITKCLAEVTEGDDCEKAFKKHRCVMKSFKKKN